MVNIAFGLFWGHPLSQRGVRLWNLEAVEEKKSTETPKDFTPAKYRIKAREVSRAVGCGGVGCEVWVEYLVGTFLGQWEVRGISLEGPWFFCALPLFGS